VPTLRSARETLPKLVLVAEPMPARLCHLARRDTACSLSVHNPARQPSPGAALFPVAPNSLRITSCRADGGGSIEITHIWRRRSWRHPRIQSSARTRPVKHSRWVCTSSSRRRTRSTKTGMPALSSTFAIVCAVRGCVQANLRANLARRFVGDLRRLRKFTNV
jgi:hypothetical protein